MFIKNSVFNGKILMRAIGSSNNSWFKVYFHHFLSFRSQKMEGKIWKKYFRLYSCDAPNPGGPLTTRQPVEDSWMSGNPKPHH